MGKNNEIIKLKIEKVEAQKLLLTLFLGMGESHEKDLALWLQIKDYVKKHNLYNDSLPKIDYKVIGKTKFD